MIRRKLAGFLINLEFIVENNQLIAKVTNLDQIKIELEVAVKGYFVKYNFFTRTLNTE